jgi:hypothetical protein
MVIERKTHLLNLYKENELINISTFFIVGMCTLSPQHFQITLFYHLSASKNLNLKKVKFDII